MINIVAIISSLIWPSFFCYFVNSTTDHVLRLGTTAYSLNWFEHPVEMQKYIVLMISRSHAKIQFSGLGLIPCTLEAFGKVCFFVVHSNTNCVIIFFFVFKLLDFSHCSLWDQPVQFMWFSDNYRCIKQQFGLLFNSKFIYALNPRLKIDISQRTPKLFFNFCMCFVTHLSDPGPRLGLYTCTIGAICISTRS